MGFGINGTGQGKTALKRPLALSCLAFSGGVFAGLYLWQGWQGLLLGALLVYLGLACLLKRNARWALLLLGVAAGLWLSWCQTSAIWVLEQRQAGQTVQLTLQVRDFPNSTQYGVYVQAKVLTQGQLEGVLLELWLPEGEELVPGDELEAEVTLSSAQESDPDWKYYALSQGIQLQGRANGAVVHSGETPWDLWPKLWAKQLGERLETLFPSETAGFLFALTTGNRSMLSETLDSELTQTGLRHVVAASGLHVHLIFSALSLLPLGRRRRGVLLLPLLVVFAAVAGFTPSICRAALMEGILLLGPLFERESDGLTSLSLALALLLGQNVYAAASVSLQLSFGAMFGLRCVCPALLRRLEQSMLHNGWRAVLRSFAVTLGANVFTLPLVLHYFGTISLLSPLSNLVVLWLLPFLLPMALLCGVLGCLCLPLAQLLAIPTGCLAQVLLQLIHLLATFPWSTLPEGQPFFAWVVLCYAVGCILYFGCCSGRQVCGGVLLLFALLPVAQWSAVELQLHIQLSASLLNVGQGQCLLLCSQGETAVIDCGGTGSQAEQALEEALAQTGAGQIDALIVTHYDQDHIGGVSDLLLEHQVSCLYLPESLAEDQERAQALEALAEQLDVPVCWVKEQEVVALGSAELSLCPVESSAYCGLAVLASQGAFELLVTGDADFAAEDSLLAQVESEAVEVLIAGHHGSAYATGQALLEAVRPQFVLFSVGTNPYGHPTQAALDRCRAAGAQLRRTDLNGTIQIEVWGEAAQTGGD